MAGHQLYCQQVISQRGLGEMASALDNDDILDDEHLMSRPVVGEAKMNVQSS